MQLYPKGVLDFPFWKMPGIPQAHPALGSRGSSTAIRFSAVALNTGNATANGCMIDLSNKGTRANTVTSVGTSIYGTIGTTAVCAGTNSLLSWTGKPVVLDTQITMAGIYVATASVAENSIFISNNNGSTASTGWMLLNRRQTSNDVTLEDISFAQIASSAIVPVVGVPYFIIASCDSATSTNFLVMNMNNGQIKTAQKAAIHAAASVPSGTYVVGNSTAFPQNQTQGGIATAMISTKFMSLQEMYAWAADPWGFWYPNYYDDAYSTLVGQTVTVTDTLFAQAWM